MKKVIILSGLVLISLFSFTSCNKDKNKNTSGKVSFSVNNNLLKNLSLKDTAINKIIISVETSEGNSVIDMKILDLYRFNDDYISDIISLRPGEYKLTSFLVVNKEDSIIYAAPKEGSEFAYLVNTPLPLFFEVNKDLTTRVTVEVLSTTSGSPEDFGYVTFCFNLINTSHLCISVFIYVEDSASFELTNAEISISSDSLEIFSGEVLAKTNSLLLPRHESYSLHIHKAGFISSNTWLTTDSLEKYDCSGRGEPLIVILEKAVLNGTLILQPGPEKGKDAFIEDYPYEGYRDRNFGYYPDFPAIAWTAGGTFLKVRSLINFNFSLIPQGTAIKNAKLSLSHCILSGHGLGHSQLSGSNQAKLCMITQDWDENTVTWNNAPTYTEEYYVDIPASIDPMQDYTDIDISNLVQLQINNPDKYFGFILILNTEEYYRKLIFSTSDCTDSSLWPKLEIEY